MCSTLKTFVMLQLLSEFTPAENIGLLSMFNIHLFVASLHLVPVQYGMISGYQKNNIFPEVQCFTLLSPST